MEKFKCMLTVLLALGMMVPVCACASKKPSTSDSRTEQTESDSDTGTDSGQNTGEPEDKEPYTVRETYLPGGLADTVAAKLKKRPALFKTYSASGAPYATQDVFGISNCRLLSISIPVYKVGTADENGDYRFTLFVVSNQYADMKKSALRSYSLRISREQYALKDNSAVTKMIKVELSDYGIVLSGTETLAYFDKQDTLYPAYVGTGANEVREDIVRAFPQTVGMFSHVGSGQLAMSNNTLIFDFEVERTYESRNAYEKLQEETRAYDATVRMLKEKYQGKYLSVIGDSISTFGDVSNNPSYNSTIGNNAVYYKADMARLAGWQYTYWGRVAQETGMKLCVNNSWSGSRVYGKPDADYADSALWRATELDHDNATPTNPDDDIKPDVILFYMGTNDLGASPFGELYDKLRQTVGEQRHELIDTWFQQVLEKTKDATDLVPGSTYTSFEQAYALTLYRMLKAYPDAEIYCLNIMRTETNDHVKVAKFNECIQAFSEYFGVALVNQYEDSGMRPANHHSYMLDVKCLHPNSAGHFCMAKIILCEMGRRHETD